MHFLFSPLVKFGGFVGLDFDASRSVITGLSLLSRQACRERRRDYGAREPMGNFHPASSFYGCPAGRTSFQQSNLRGPAYRYKRCGENETGIWKR
jgi:hypothetical protein